MKIRQSPKVTLHETLEKRIEAKNHELRTRARQLHGKDATAVIESIRSFYAALIAFANGILQPQKNKQEAEAKAKTLARKTGEYERQINDATLKCHAHEANFEALIVQQTFDFEGQDYRLAVISTYLISFLDGALAAFALLDLLYMIPLALVASVIMGFALKGTTMVLARVIKDAPSPWGKFGLWMLTIAVAIGFFGALGWCREHFLKQSGGAIIPIHISIIISCFFYLGCTLIAYVFTTPNKEERELRTKSNREAKALQKATKLKDNLIAERDDLEATLSSHIAQHQDCVTQAELTKKSLEEQCKESIAMFQRETSLYTLPSSNHVQTNS